MAQFEHPETGKVLNPATGHWVQKSYAKGRGFLKEARLHTAEHFKKQEKEAKKEKKTLNEQERENTSKEQLDETARVTFDMDETETEVDGLISDIEQREQLGDDFNADDFFNVNMPEMDDDVGFDPRMKDGNFPGIYSTNNPDQSAQPTRRERARGRKRDTQDIQKRYVRTETGGIKIVRPGDEEWNR